MKTTTLHAIPNLPVLNRTRITENLNMSGMAIGLCKTTRVLFLVILVVLCGVGVAQAGQGDSTKTPPVVSDSMALQNSHYKGIPSPHSNRKDAAKRLKKAHLQQEHLKHHGVKVKQGQNQPSTNVPNHQTPAKQGGV